MLSTLEASFLRLGAITSQWWRRMVNAYEVKAGMVYTNLSTLTF